MGFGVDFGATSIKVVRVQRTLRGFRLVGAARSHIPPGGDRKGEAVHALRDILSKTNPGIGVVGLGGRDVNLQVVQQSAMAPANYRAMMGYELEQRRGAEGELYGDFATLREPDPYNPGDRKSTRLNSSHVEITYAVLCLKQKNNPKLTTR